MRPYSPKRQLIFILLAEKNAHFDPRGRDFFLFNTIYSIRLSYPPKLFGGSLIRLITPALNIMWAEIGAKVTVDRAAAPMQLFHSIQSQQAYAGRQAGGEEQRQVGL